MKPQNLNSERSLRRLIVDLASIDPQQVREIFAELDPKERVRVEELFSKFLENENGLSGKSSNAINPESDGTTQSVPDSPLLERGNFISSLSNWLAIRVLSGQEEVVRQKLTSQWSIENKLESEHFLKTVRMTSAAQNALLEAVVASSSAEPAKIIGDQVRSSRWLRIFNRDQQVVA